MDELTDDEVMVCVTLIQQQHSNMRLFVQQLLLLLDQEQAAEQHRLRRRKAAIIQYLMLISSAAVYALPLSLLIDEPRLFASSSPRLDITSLSDAEALLRFRFTIAELAEIANAMRLSPVITVNRVSVSAIEGLAIMLRRLVYPSRLYDLAGEFGRDISSVCRISNHMLELVYNQYEQHLKLWPGVTPTKVAAYAASITRFEPAVIDMWAFLDGTHRDIARPQLHQRATYNGKNRTHQLRYQLVLAPDGLFVSCCGPFVGTRHDVTILHESRLQQALLPLVTNQRGHYVMYGDAAYVGEPLIMHPYIDPQPRSIQARYNTMLSSLRVRVENNFANMNNHFCMPMLKKSQRSGLQPVALYFFINVLFTNIHTCMKGANIPFDIAPPSLQLYLL